MSDTSKIPARRIEGLEEALQSISFPDQTNNNGKFLSTDGENPSWKFPSVIKDIESLTEIGLSQLIINRLSQEKYDELLSSGLINDDELYITSDDKEYYTKDEVDNLIQDNNVPTKVSELENDLNYLQNQALESSAISILGEPTSNTRSINIGFQSVTSANYSTALGSHSQATGSGSVALGRGARATKNNSVAIGVSSQSLAPGAIALGAQAVNNEEKTLKVALTTNNDLVPAVDESTGLYTLLKSDGKIPNERLNLEDYALKSEIPNVSNKADKETTYTKQEVDAIINNKFQVVDTLPDNPDPNVFYFIKE